ncbi:MAG: glutathione S-transferase family protein [Cellvibrionaceae bacterium]|nr:glutathione S-transferase family protein [Cellvibrionaceae bacterium]
MAKMTFYTHPWSRGRIVRWMLEEVGADYEVVVKEFGGSIKEPDYLAINPMGKVPALVDDGVVITEVAAICTYLAEKFPEKNLAPPIGSPARGTYFRWIFFIAGPLEMATTARAFNWRIDAENSQAVGCGFIKDTINAMELAIQKGPYICGDQFTTADLLAASYLGWEMQQKNIEERPAFREYLQRMDNRPAGQRATQLDDALVKKTEPA